MDNSQQTTDLYPYLKALYKYSQLLGFSNLNFNRSSRLLEYSRIRYLIPRIAFQIICLVSGLLAGGSVVGCRLIPYEIAKNSLEAQNFTFMGFGIILSFVSTWNLARSYLALAHTLLPMMNEMFKIFKLLEKKSDSKIIFQSTFKPFITLKLAHSFYYMLRTFDKNWSNGLILMTLISYIEISRIVTYLAYMYSQLVLVCFYMKMNGILQVPCLNMTKSTFTRNVRDLLRISFRIHRVKQNLNKFFSAVFLSTYLGAFLDMSYMYLGLSEILLYKSSNGMIGSVFCTVLIRLPYSVGELCNIYLIGRLSDMLIDSVKSFEQKIMLLICENRLNGSTLLEREIEQLMIRSNVYDLNCRTCQVIDMDLRTSLPFVINMTFICVLSCLQYYASKRIYS